MNRFFWLASTVTFYRRPLEVEVVALMGLEGSRGGMMQWDFNVLAKRWHGVRLSGNNLDEAPGLPGHNQTSVRGKFILPGGKLQFVLSCLLPASK